MDYAFIFRCHKPVMVPRRADLLMAAQGANDFCNDDAIFNRAQFAAAAERKGAVFA